ncbi:MAG TPA: FKBP-type peptidyl-prolyl cis-trans isomerase [Vicinamibacterales bacterium]|nr:FKBP-type peptidyl-prolyl cis-trans isomerase [Vicinamibacterales bacterium]
MKYAFSVLILAVLAAAGCGGGTPTSPSVGLNVPFSATDITVGTGAEAVTGRNITVQYSGWLYDPNAAQNKGQAFDAGTFTYVLGTTVITGWNQGIPGMRVGGSRRLVIPPSLGYGAAGSGTKIPGNATLLFEVTLIAVQ